MTEENGKQTPEEQSSGATEEAATAGESTAPAGEEKPAEEATAPAGEEKPASEPAAETEPAVAQEPAAASEPAAAPGPPRAKGLRIAYLVMCLLGLAASIELMRLHVKAHTRPSERSFCSVHSKVDCLSVAESPYAVFLGMPVAAWATLAFVVLLAGTVVVLVRQWRRPVQPSEGSAGGGGGGGGDALAGLTFVMSLGAVGVTVFMAVISHVIIGSLCLVCAVLYAVNPTLAVLSWRMTKRHGGVKKAIVADVEAVRRRPGLTAGIVVAGLAVAGAGMAFYPNYWRYTGPVGPGDLPHGVTEDGHHWIGAKKPEIILHEFSDYECGFCRRFNTMMRELLVKKEFRTKIRVVHYHYPLDQSCNRTVPQPFHMRACELARAAHCAGEQGKFWHMHDMIYARRRPGGPAVLGLAGKLGLDQRRFRKCMESDEAKATIKADIDFGERMSLRAAGRGIVGTPTYFLEKPGHEPRAMMPNEQSLRVALEEIPLQRGPAGLAHGVTEEGAPWIGAREPRLTLYEASDYNCFYCMRGHFKTRQLLTDKAFRDAVRLVHVQYPFDSQCNSAFTERQHPRACGLARAALCAKAEGKFWEMNDLIYRSAGAGRIPSLPVLGHRLRLNRKRFVSCLASQEVKEGLGAEIRFAEKLGALDKKGIDGIPAVFYRKGAGPILRLTKRVDRKLLGELLGSPDAPRQ